MDAAAPLFLRLAGEIRGPFAEPQLRDLVDGGVISPDTESAPARDGPWAPLRSRPLAATLFPPPPAFRLKGAAFDVVNRDTAPPVDHRAMIAAANQPPPAAALESLRNLADTPPAAPAGPNEVERLVRAVAHREAAVRAAAPPPPPKPSRVLKRLRHFALYAGAGDALLAALALHYGRFDDGISLQIWMAWGLIFTFAVAILVFFFDSAG